MSNKREGIKELSHRVRTRLAPRSSMVVPKRDWVFQAEIRKLTAREALVLTDMPCPGHGQCVRLDFRMPDGAELSLCAMARPRDVAEVAGRRDVELHFVGLEPTEQTALAQHLEAGRLRPPAVGLEAQIAEMFLVETEGETISIRLSGVLRRVDSEELLAQIREQLAPRRAGRMLAYIDASNLHPCPEDSLYGLRACLAFFLRHEPFYAVAVIRNAIAMLQVRRLAREAGIAHYMACFEDESDAMTFWNEIRGQTLTG